MKPRLLELTYNASGAAEAARRGRVVVVVDIVDSSTSAEAASAAGAVAIFGAAPARVELPVPVRPRAVGIRAAEVARSLDTDVVVVGEPRVGPAEERVDRVLPVLEALEAEGVAHHVVPNQGAELSSLISLAGRVVVIVSTTGGSAFDAAMVANAPAVCFATTARVAGKPGAEVAAEGARRAIAFADEHDANISVVAASANSTDDCLAAFEIARTIIAEGFLRL